MVAQVPGARRGLRTDAARNHERIVAAAAVEFEETGPGVSLEQIARRAGVGVATLYRRFGNRDQLITAVAEHVLAVEVAVMVDAVGAHRVLAKLVGESGGVAIDAIAALTSDIGRVLRRARDAGVVRPELTVRDLGAVVLMALTVVRRSGDPADTRRYLALLLDGLRPTGHPLPAGAET